MSWGREYDGRVMTVDEQRDRGLQTESAVMRDASSDSLTSRAMVVVLLRQ